MRCARDHRRRRPRPRHRRPGRAGQAPTPRQPAAVSRLGGIIGLVEASLVAALVVTVVRRPRARRGSEPTGSRGSLSWCPRSSLLGLVAAGAHAADIRPSKRPTQTFGGDSAWVEAAKPGPTVFVQTRREQPLHRDGHDGLEPVDRSRRSRSGSGTSSGSTVSARARCPRQPRGPARARRDGRYRLGAVRDRRLDPDLHRGRPRRQGSLLQPGHSLREHDPAQGVRRGCPLEQHGRLAAVAITAYPTPAGHCTTATLQMSLPSGSRRA